MNEIKFIGNIFPTKTRNNPNQGRVYDTSGISPTLSCCGGGNLQPFIIVGSTQKNAYVGNGTICPTLTEAMGMGGGQVPMIGENISPINTMTDGTCRTLKSQYYKTSYANFNRSSTFGATGVTDGIKIRKLTPKECFRLMGFNDEDYEVLVENGISNSQIYKMAGNSIVVNVLEKLLLKLLIM